MAQRIGRLTRVPIVDVWSDEARDLNPWLAENLDDLSEALGMNLELLETEVSVGPFRADLLLRVQESDERIVVELMMAKTDHDHIGKLIRTLPVWKRPTQCW